MKSGHENIRYLNPVYVGDTHRDRRPRNAKRHLELLTLDVILENQNGEAVVDGIHSPSTS